VYFHESWEGTHGFEDKNFDYEDKEYLAAWISTLTAEYAATSEMRDLAKEESLGPELLRTARGIEVGHIFYFGTKYSAPMNCGVSGPDGAKIPVHMGSYGIGPSRVVAAIIEANHDENGMIWPESVAPFDVGLVSLKVGDPAVNAVCADLYAKLQKAGKTVLYDDSSERPGTKFATMDLIGLPWQLIVGPKGLAEGQVELKYRRTGERILLTPEAALNKLTA
jgi:prolyl-tRNA synthetase